MRYFDVLSITSIKHCARKRFLPSYKLCNNLIHQINFPGLKFYSSNSTPAKNGTRSFSGLVPNYRSFLRIFQIGMWTRGAHWGVAGVAAVTPMLFWVLRKVHSQHQWFTKSMMKKGIFQSNIIIFTFEYHNNHREYPVEIAITEKHKIEWDHAKMTFFAKINIFAIFFIIFGIGKMLLEIKRFLKKHPIV